MIWPNGNSTEQLKVCIGDKYEGEWKHCKKHGKGQDYFVNGNEYIGRYQDGIPDGQGEYYWKDGSFYKG